MTGNRPHTAPGADALRDVEERLRSRMNVLEDTHDRLRRRVRLVTLVLLAVVALLVAVAIAPELVGAVRSGGVLDVTTLRLVDAAGNVRGEWGVDDDGAIRIGLFDQQRRPRMNLAVLRNGSPGVALLDETGQRRAALGLLPDQTASMVFADARGTLRAVLGLTTTDAANLVFADADGISRLGMGLDRNGIGSVMMPPDSVLESSVPGSPGGGP